MWSLIQVSGRSAQAVTVAPKAWSTVTRQGLRLYRDALDARLDPRGRPYYWIGGEFPSGVEEEGTGEDAVGGRAGGVALGEAGERGGEVPEEGRHEDDAGAACRDQLDVAADLDEPAGVVRIEQ